jgi:putative holliday junction resolvase
MFDILAIDWGERKIGLAIGSTLSLLSLPVKTIKNYQHSDLFTEINSIIKKYSIRIIVVGYPTNFKFKKTETTLKIENFIKELSSQAISNIRIHQILERNTTQVAQSLIRSNTNPPKDDDSISAMLLINHYLNTY